MMAVDTNTNQHDSGGGGSIQCSLYHMDVLWRHKIISVCQLQQCWVVLK